MVKPSPHPLRQHATRITALACIAVLYGLARPPQVSRPERAVLASHFHFTRYQLPDLPEAVHHQVREVNPSLQKISAWISSVGASVALSDLDGDGLPNDVAWVDPRTDLVNVAPVPGTPARFRPFSLDPSPLPYDRATMAPMGCLPADLNEDGRMDILVYYWGRTPVAFLRTGPDTSPSLPDEKSAAADPGLSAASYVPCEIVPTGERWFTNAATCADVDGDGHVDIIIGNYFPDGSRILDAHSTAEQTMQHSMSRANNGGRNRFLLWAGATSGPRPSVEFRDASDQVPERLLTGWTLAIGAQDLDGDLLPEVYFANDFGTDRLLHNKSTPGALRFEPLLGNKTFTTPSSKVLGRDSFKGMGVDFADLNGDGLPDIFVSNITSRYALLESNFTFLSTGNPGRMSAGVAPYRDASEELGLSRAGWAWDARLADFDNGGVPQLLQATGFVKGDTDRWPELQELAMGNDELLSHPESWPRFRPGDDLNGHQHLAFFVRDRRGRYTDLSTEVGLDQPMVSRGLAVADVDGDGALDFAVANQWDTSYFFHNDAPAHRAFLGLHLLLRARGIAPGATVEYSGHPDGRVSTRPAIGASAKVGLPGGRNLVGQVDGGNGHSGKRSPDLHFGLGEVDPGLALPVELRWRDRTGQVRQETLRLTPGWHTVILGG